MEINDCKKPNERKCTIDHNDNNNIYNNNDNYDNNKSRR